MRKFILIFLVISLNCICTIAQTKVNGAILSVNGEPLPIATIDVSATGPANVFTLPDKVYADKHGDFEIIFENPGIYTLSVRGVFHKTLQMPLMIYDQESVSLDIHLLPNSYNSGEYFDRQVYTEWIRAFGNFNDYDFFSGEIFRANNDGSISAFIKTDIDTIRYQVRGITRGVTVLPGTDDYRVRNDDFEAVLYNTSDADSVELRFNPNEDQPYESALPEGPVSWQVPLSAFIHFHKESDKFWSTPLSRSGAAQLHFRTLSNPARNGVPAEFLKQSMFRSYDFRSTQYMEASRDSVINSLKQDHLHPLQRSALLISYVGLIEMHRTRERYLENIGQQPPKLQIDRDIFNEIYSTVNPGNPVWALNHDAPLILLNETNFSDKAVAYAEQMVRQHSDDMVVRNLVLRLIEKRADEFKDVRNMPYYEWIVKRYGENNLARRAINTFEQAHQAR